METIYASTGPESLEKAAKVETLRRIGCCPHEKPRIRWRKAGIKGTISQGVSSMELRQTLSLGLARTHLQHVTIPAAINSARFFSWLAEERLQKRGCLRSWPWTFQPDFADKTKRLRYLSLFFHQPFFCCCSRT